MLIELEREIRLRLFCDRFRFCFLDHGLDGETERLEVHREPEDCSDGGSEAGRDSEEECASHEEFKS
jgi:hypothetical protein